MSNIKLYKNRYGKEPLVVGTVGTKMSEYNKGEIWCPYIPLMFTPAIEPTSMWKRFQIKFEIWFHDICHREYR